MLLAQRDRQHADLTSRLRCSVRNNVSHWNCFAGIKWHPWTPLPGGKGATEQRQGWVLAGGFGGLVSLPVSWALGNLRVWVGVCRQCLERADCAGDQGLLEMVTQGGKSPPPVCSRPEPLSWEAEAASAGPSFHCLPRPRLLGGFSVSESMRHQPSAVAYGNTPGHRGPATRRLELPSIVT